MKRSKKAGLIVGVVVGVLVVLGVVAYALVGNCFYELALNLKNMSMVEMTTQTGNEGMHFSLEDDWLKQRSRALEVSVQSQDDLKLTGLEINNPIDSHHWMITIHGYRGDSSMQSSFAKYFYDKGYHAIMPNLRGMARARVM